MRQSKLQGPSSRRSATVDELTRQNVETISAMECAIDNERTMGDRIADGFALTVGSWAFIIIQSVLLTAWVTLNVASWCRHWDAYPFTFLNLALSFQAAYASPIIMMSQNRQARLSDRRNHLDLQINLLSEQENTQMMQMLRKVCEKLEIPIENVDAIRALEQPVKPEKLAHEIDKSVAAKKIAEVKNLKKPQENDDEKDKK